MSKINQVTVGGTTYDLEDTSKVSDNPTFTEASTRANIASGETVSTLFGKIKKWFSDLKSGAFEEATQPLLATIETSATASKAYTIGEQFIYEGLLYKATSAITQGDTIVIGGNCSLADNITKQIKDNKKTGYTIGYATKNIALNDLSWSTSSAGKKYCSTAFNTGKTLISVSLKDFTLWQASDVIQPYINGTYIGVTANTSTFTGKQIYVIYAYIVD